MKPNFIITSLKKHRIFWVSFILLVVILNLYKFFPKQDASFESLGGTEIIAPEAGDDITVAKHYIFNLAEQPCGKVLSAKRDAKGFISANCSNGEKYIIAIFKDAPMTNGTRSNVPVAMKCSLAQSMLKISCPN